MRDAPLRLVRDRPTLLLYSQLAIWAYFIYSFTPVVSLLRIEQDTSRTVASLHSTAFAVGSVIGGGMLTPLLAQRFDRNTRIWSGLSGVAVAVAALMVIRSFPGTMTCTLAIAVSGAIAVNAMTAALSDHHGPAGAAAISEANAFAAAIGLVAPLAVGLAVSAGAGWRPGMGVLIGLIAVTVAVAAGARVRVPRDRVLPAPARPGRMPRRYWLVFVAILTTASVEIMMYQWVADVLLERTGMSRGAATACVSTIIGGIVLGRLAAGRLALRCSSAVMMLGGLAVSAVGFVIFWVATAGWIAVIGLVVCGFGIAVHFPLGMALAIDHSDGQADLATARSAYAFGFAFGVAPFLLAAIADQIDPHTAFLLVPVFLAVAAVAILPIARGGPGGASAGRRDSSVPEVGELQPERSQ